MRLFEFHLSQGEMMHVASGFHREVFAEFVFFFCADFPDRLCDYVFDFFETLYRFRFCIFFMCNHVTVLIILLMSKEILRIFLKVSCKSRSFDLTHFCFYFQSSFLPFSVIFQINWGLYKSGSFHARMFVFFSFFLIRNILIYVSSKGINCMFLLKKVCLLLILTSIAIGCSSKNRLNEWMKESPRVKILSTTAQIGDLAEEIGGERVDGWVLIQGDLDPHSYEIVKGDDEKLARAQLIFYNGL